MIVTMKRQKLEIRTSAEKPHRKKKSQWSNTFVPLRGSVETPGISDIILRHGHVFICAMALMVFLPFCGSEKPYTQIKALSLPGLRSLEIPDKSLLNSLNIKTLRAETESIPVLQNPVERIVLWDLPHSNYVMNRNDTISQISRQYHISISTLLSINKIDNVKRMSEGMSLIIPQVEGILYTIKKGETLQDVAIRFSLDSSYLIPCNPYITLRDKQFSVHAGQELFIPGAVLHEQVLREQMGELFIFPVQGNVIKNYGNSIDDLTQIETFHNGIDIKGNSGDAVTASLDGKVIAIGFNSSYGNYIILEHQGGYRSLYAQLQDRAVQKNDKVLQGQMIATVGTSGYTREPHLHFSLFKGKKSIDPMDYLH